MQVEIPEGPLQETIEKIIDAYEAAAACRDDMKSEDDSSQRRKKQAAWLEAELQFLEACGLNLELVSALLTPSESDNRRFVSAHIASDFATTRLRLFNSILKQHCVEIEHDTSD